MTNCAVMNIPPTEAKKLSLWEYEALVYHWNEAHDSKDDVASPDPIAAMTLLNRLAADPRMTN